MTTPDDASTGENPSAWGAPTDPDWGRPADPAGQTTPGGQPPYGAQPPYGGHPPPGPQQSWGYPGYGYPAMPVPGPAHPSATTALVLGIVSLVGALVCFLPVFAAPFAWVIGGRAVREIDENPQRWSGRESANAGRIMGIVGTAILILSLLALLGFILVTVAVESS